MEESNLDRRTFTLKRSQIVKKKEQNHMQVKSSKGEESKLNRPINWQTSSSRTNNRNETNVYETNASSSSSGLDYHPKTTSNTHVLYRDLESLGESDYITKENVPIQSTPRRDSSMSFHLSEITDRSITIPRDSELQRSLNCSIDEILASSFAESVRELRKSSIHSFGSGVLFNNGPNGNRSNQSITQGLIDNSTRSLLLKDKDRTRWSNRCQSRSLNENNISIGEYFALRSDRFSHFIQKESQIKDDDPVVLFSDTTASTYIVSENASLNNECIRLSEFDRMLDDMKKEKKLSISDNKIAPIKKRIDLEHNKENIQLQKNCSAETYFTAESLRTTNDAVADAPSHCSLRGSSSTHACLVFDKDVRYHSEKFVPTPWTDPASSIVMTKKPIIPPTDPSRNVPHTKDCDGKSFDGISSQSSSKSEFSHRDGEVMPLKITEPELSWASVKLRTNSKKSLQVKNTSQKPLKLRIEIDGSGFNILNPASVLTLQPQECQTIVVNFYPTVLGLAIGSLIFRPPRSLGKINVSKTDSNIPKSNSNEIIIPLYAYGGHSCIVMHDLLKGPVGPTFLSMGELCTLVRRLERSFQIYNKGPLLGFAAFLIEPVSLRTHEISMSLRIYPQCVLIEPKQAVTICLTFEPSHNDLKNIGKTLVDVMTLAKVRIFYGDEVTRQRLRQMQQQLIKEEKEKVFTRSPDMLWSRFPGEIALFPLSLFEKTTTSNAQDMLACISEQEVALTLNHNALDETAAELSSIFTDEDSSILFGTYCEPTPKKTIK